MVLKDGTVAYVYGPGGLPLEQISGSTALWLHHDQLGSTRLATDSLGTAQGTYSYDAFGNLTASTGTISNPFRFAGQYVDAESGLYYLRARYYDPATGQFLSVDPSVAATGQPYGYVAGNPLNASDPSGRLPADVDPLLWRMLQTPQQQLLDKLPNQLKQLQSMEDDLVNDPLLRNLFNTEWSEYNLHIDRIQYLQKVVEYARQALGENCPASLAAWADRLLKFDPVKVRGRASKPSSSPSPSASASPSPPPDCIGNGSPVACGAPVPGFDPVPYPWSFPFRFPFRIPVPAFG